MLKEEAMKIKKCLNQEELENFTALNEWLENCKFPYGIRERRINGEASEVSGYTVSAWMKRLCVNKVT